MPALRPRRHPAIVTLVLLVITAAGPAMGQGTSGTLPDPISVVEMERYALRLRLSPAQQQAVATLHEAYQQEFRVLRDGEIAELMLGMRGLQGAGMMPDRDRVVEILEGVGLLERRIATLDNHLFDRMSTVLDDEQIGRLPRVRGAGRGGASASEMTWFGTGRPPDISDIVLDLDLEGETRDVIDATLLPYERRLTPRLVELAETSRGTMVSMFDALAERGFNEETMQDPEKMMEMIEAAQEVMREISRAAMERSDAIWELTRKTADSVGDRLPDATRRRFRDTFLERGYPQIAPAVRYDRERFDLAIALDGLGDERRDSIVALRDRVEIDMSRIDHEGRSALDDWRRDRDLFDMTGESWRSRSNIVQSLAGRGETIRTKAAADLEAILGPELLARLDAPGGGAPAGEGDATAAAATAATPEPAQSPQDALAGQLLPGRITDAEAEHYGRMLALDDDGRAILTTLHQDYVEAFASIEANELADVRRHETAAQGQDGNPDPLAVDLAHNARRAAMSVIRRTDEAFFDEVQAALLDGTETPRLERVRWHRRRVTYRRGSAMSFGLRPSQEGQIDIARLVERQRLADDDLVGVEPALLDWERQAAGLFETRWSHLVDARRALDRWMIELRQMQQDGENWTAWNERWQELVGDVQARTKESDTAVEQLNAKTLTAMVEALGPDGGAAIESAYLRQAFPQIYIDETAAGTTLDRALDLPDLSPEQRGELADLAAGYRPNYRGLSERMATLQRALQVPTMGNDRAAWSDYASKQDQIARLRFERTELNGRTIGRLPSILTADQLAAIGPLPDLARARGGQWWE